LTHSGESEFALLDVGISVGFASDAVHPVKGIVWVAADTEMGMTDAIEIISEARTAAISLVDLSIRYLVPVEVRWIFYAYDLNRLLCLLSNTSTSSMQW
jgi:hypothetical protein